MTPTLNLITPQQWPAHKSNYLGAADQRLESLDERPSPPPPVSGERWQLGEKQKGLTEDSGCHQWVSLGNQSAVIQIDATIGLDGEETPEKPGAPQEPMLLPLLELPSRSGPQWAAPGFPEAPAQ